MCKSLMSTRVSADYVQRYARAESLPGARGANVNQKGGSDDGDQGADKDETMQDGEGEAGESEDGFLSSSEDEEAS